MVIIFFLSFFLWRFKMLLLLFIINILFFGILFWIFDFVRKMLYCDFKFLMWVILIFVIILILGFVIWDSLEIFLKLFMFILNIVICVFFGMFRIEIGRFMWLLKLFWFLKVLYFRFNILNIYFFVEVLFMFLVIFIIFKWFNFFFI